jgi:hypothetical protein
MIMIPGYGVLDDIRRFRASHAAIVTSSRSAASAVVIGAWFVGIWLRPGRGSPPNSLTGMRTVSGLHRRLEVVPGAQARQLGRPVLAHFGIPQVYSFHLVLLHSRDPFCCFTTSMDLTTFRDYRDGGSRTSVASLARWSTTATKP